MSAAKTNKEKDESVLADSDDSFQYEEVSLGEWSLTEGEEDLEATVKAIRDRADASANAAAAPRRNGTQQPEAVDDFLRNFLSQMGMTETLDCFQTEWAELVQKGQVDTDRVGVVPDVYTENQRLDSELKNSQREGEEYRRAARAGAEVLARVKKDRDLHRMQHKRVVQEKTRLIEEIRKLKVQCDAYEPAVKRMNEKYQNALKQTMLVSVEMDKALEQAQNYTPVCVEGTANPVIQPRPPASAKSPISQTRVKSVKANVCWNKNLLSWGIILWGFLVLLKAYSYVVVAYFIMHKIDCHKYLCEKRLYTQQNT